MKALIDRAAAANPLPDGTMTVGVGLIVNGMAAYAVLAVAGRALGPDAFEPLSVLWAMIYLVGPGVFLPLEQEVGRALADRWARRIGTGPLVRQAGVIGAGLAVLLVVATLAGAALLLDRLFDDQVLLLVGFLLALVGYAIVYLTRGMLAGMGRFRAYSRYYVAENLLRLSGCVVLAIVGTATAGPYGIVVGVAPLVAVFLSLRGEQDLVTSGPPAPWGELSAALGSLLAASALTAFLLYAGPIAVRLLSTTEDSGDAGRFLAALALARVPVFMFQAVQAALLPKLSALAGAGRFIEFRSRLVRLLVVVAAIGVLGALGAVMIGPEIVRLLFGGEFDVGRRDITLLALSSAAFMLAVSLGQALIALEGQAWLVLGWLSGAVTFLAVLAVGDDVFLRVEMGLTLGSAVAAAVLGLLLVVRLHGNLSPSPHTLVSEGGTPAVQPNT